MTTPLWWHITTIVVLLGTQLLQAGFYRRRIHDLEGALEMRAALMPAPTQAVTGRSYCMATGDTMEFVGTGVAICLPTGAATVEVRIA